MAARSIPFTGAVPRWHTGSAAEPAWTLTMAGMTNADDRTLVEACLAGDTASFDVLVERHRRQVYQVCYRFVGNHEDASDLAQETFLRAWRGLKSFKGQAALSTWLYRIAVNACLNRVAARKPDAEPILADEFEDTRHEDPRTRLIRGERAAVVRRAIAELPKKQR